MNNVTTLPIRADQKFNLTPQTIDEAIRFAELLSKANLVPKDYQGNPANCLIAMQWGMEIGLQPLQAMQSIAVINGRPSIWGDAALALVRGSGLLEAITETQGETEATCTVKRRGEPETTRIFTMDDAQKAGLKGKQGPWAQYPRRMLQMRARSWALRDVFPDVLRGVFVAEEAQDMPIEKDITPQPEVAAPQPASRAESVREKLASRKAPHPEKPAPVTLDQVLAAIAASLDDGALLKVADMAAKLSAADDKDAARKAFAARKRELLAQAAQSEAEPAAVDTETGEMFDMDTAPY